MSHFCYSGQKTHLSYTDQLKKRINDAGAIKQDLNILSWYIFLFFFSRQDGFDARIYQFQREDLLIQEATDCVFDLIFTI